MCSAFLNIWNAERKGVNFMATKKKAAKKTAKKTAKKKK
jgi:hypothetical protein